MPPFDRTALLTACALLRVLPFHDDSPAPIRPLPGCQVADSFDRLGSVPELGLPAMNVRKETALAAECDASMQPRLADSDLS